MGKVIERAKAPKWVMKKISFFFFLSLLPSSCAHIYNKKKLLKTFFFSRIENEEALKKTFPKCL
jgi:hypothetical protein